VSRRIAATGAFVLAVAASAALDVVVGHEDAALASEQVLELVTYRAGTADLDLTDGTNRRVLRGVVAAMTNDGHIEKLLIEGHADRSEPSPQRLSEERADRALDWLVANGVPAARLATRGLGASEPLDRTNSDAARRKNRRLMFRIVATSP
jgi:outer membrane protein OmpA-like peptidoglycan-associated protein